MKQLYEDFKEMLIDNQKEVMSRKEQFKREVKVLTKSARDYRLQLDGYGEEIERNIIAVNNRLKQIKD